MNLANRIRQFWNPPPPDPSDEKYHRAVELSDELIKTMREQNESSDPFRALLAGLFLQHHDPKLVADAYEISQEAKIFRGPP